MKGRPNGDLVRRRAFSESPYCKPDWGNTGTLAHEQFAERAEAGSSRLLNATNRLFQKWEIEHGFKAGAAKLLLPAGYQPNRESQAA